MYKNIYVSLLIYLSCVSKLGKCLKNTPNIAVIGGGIGGTSCAYFLRDLFGKTSKITLFERDAIGGRLNTINVDGQHYESGGAVIHPKNKYMTDFYKLLGLSPRKPPPGRFGIYDGDKFVFEESKWSFVTALQLFWNYGFSVFQLAKDVTSMLNDFARIYDLQSKEIAFTTVYGMLDSMSPRFPNMTQATISSLLLKKSYSQRFIDELVQSIMMVNYGQTKGMSGFAGFVSLAGADSNLFSISGGNKLVPEGLLKASEAQPINGEVLEIELLPDTTYSLKYVDIPVGTTLTLNFDIVILSAPLIKGKPNIKFTNFKKDFQQYESEFHRTVATFVQGELDPAAFNSDSVPSEILTSNSNLYFNSVGNVHPVKDELMRNSSEVYKVFSRQPLTKKDISYLFKRTETVREVDWMAYPHYEPPDNLPPFFLYPGLYYTNAIELAASAMEMSAISGKNAALLAFNLWNNMVDKVDQHTRVYRDEL